MRCLPLLLLTALPALGDEVRLRNGALLVGDARLEGEHVVVDVGPGTVTLHVRDVKEIRRSDGSVETPERPASGRRLADADVRDAVEEELRTDPGIGSTPFRIDVRDGIVYLKGQAKALSVGDRAVALASIVKGVRDVRNEIEIESCRSDDDLRAALGPDVALRDGVVTVKAASPSAAAELRDIEGVRELRVELEPKARPDEEIRREIEEALRWDAAVDPAKINVSVVEGKAVLTGTVLSAAEKARAVEDAWVEGARSVDASGLDTDDRERARSRNERTSDADVKAAVEARLRRSGAGEAQVEVREGEVFLRGVVATLALVRKAGREARGVAGVRGVENRLVPRSRTPDAATAAEVEAALRRDPFVQEAVKASVKEGVARLSGVVGSYFEKARADERAASVPGVRAVENALEVAASAAPLVTDPYVDRLDARDYAWYPPPARPSLRPDAELRAEIERRFFWSPYVDATRVRVAVLDGQAILSGSVDSLLERDAAERVALKAGAPAVLNRLTVN
jgi:osmotically-inducible protein OsmY